MKKSSKKSSRKSSPKSAPPAPKKSSKQKSVDIPAEELALYGALVATQPDVERKGDTVPYTSVNGHMFSFMDRNGKLALRMFDADREAFLARFATPPVVSYGIVMKEYVGVPDALLRKTRDLKPWFAKSYTHVRALKPKPTTKKK
jgi:TfoX/Sxy family transcriptional regulator of competence genes